MSDSKQYFGRKVLYTTEETIDSSNIAKVLMSVLTDYEVNKGQIDYLYRYWKGEQPILNRVKKVRPEINNKVVENHAHEIVSFAKGYSFGEPIQYVRHATKSGTDLKDNPNMTPAEEDSDITSKICILNEYMFMRGKEQCDQSLADWLLVCGTSYRMTLPTDETDYLYGVCPFNIDVTDPRYTAIVYYNGFGHRPMMSIQEVVNSDGNTVYCMYTSDSYYEIELEEGMSTEDLADITPTVTPHTLGMIPIVEYPANNARIGAFELVMGLLDEINNVESNRIDGIEQFVQAFMKFVNVNITKEEYDEFREAGAIKFKSDPGAQADVDIVSSELNQDYIQETLDHLYQMVLIICGMPDRQGSGKTSGDTGQAVILRDGWSFAEAKSKEIEGMFKLSERRFLALVLKILETSDKLDIKLSDIDIKFIPNKTDNLLAKTQALQVLFESGIHPQIAITKSGLFGDPEQVYLDSQPYLSKWLPESQADDTKSTLKPLGEPSVDITPTLT